MKQTALVALAGGAMCATGVVGFAIGHGSPAPTPTRLVAQDQTQPEQPGISMDDLKKMVEEEAAPAPQHETLRPFVGEWDAEMHFMMAPGQEPDVSHGTETISWVLGNRFLKMDFKGEMKMGELTMPFTGLGLMGFDKVQNKYVMTWCDTFSTGMLYSTGEPGDDGKTISVLGSMKTMAGEATMRTVYKMESDKKFTLEFYQSAPDMDEMKIGWINFTKKG